MAVTKRNRRPDFSGRRREIGVICLSVIQAWAICRNYRSASSKLNKPGKRRGRIYAEAGSLPIFSPNQYHRKRPDTGGTIHPTRLSHSQRSHIYALPAASK